ncbi:hypothetical protein CJ030_MR8G020242 [Morella rubra]|uniref:F-box associated domain-containing protein n=1 Tax=Morella rubra TaxID=262757 RepID=A0A6A1UNT6_9ROSI|nr:hypothetical protein CJ030_MR8G020242 [Morella rubra]
MAIDWEAILSFDMRNEVALAVHIKGEEPFDMDIWLLLAYGVKESWTKLFTVGPLTGITLPLGFWKNDPMFFGKSNGERACLV